MNATCRLGFGEKPTFKVESSMALFNHRSDVSRQYRVNKTVSRLDECLVAVVGVNVNSGNGYNCNDYCKCEYWRGGKYRFRRKKKELR